MIKYGSRSTVTTAETQDSAGERRVRRLRLTLHDNDVTPGPGKNTGAAEGEEKTATRRRKNGYKYPDREPPVLHLSGTSSGGSAETRPQGKVFGVVRRNGTDTGSQEEVVACEWSVNHLRQEMNYIREVRDSLEKVRQRMYGEFGGMQKSIKKLSQEINVANSQQQSLQAEVNVKTAALESFDQMNSSLMSATIDLQKSLLESCLDRTEMREEMRGLRLSYNQAVERLKEKGRQLEAAQAENETLRLKIESSQEANSQVLQDMTQKLYREYEEQLQEEQRKHREEIEVLQAKIDAYVRQIEECNEKMKAMEAKITERDQRISELERLIDCMEQERAQLLGKLQECEARLHRLRQADRLDADAARRALQLEQERSGLKERIKHLNDMVFCQQRKVKTMIEEAETLRSRVVQKDMYITELLDRIAIVECENNELQDKMNYLHPDQNGTEKQVQTREIGVGCDLLSRPDRPAQVEVLSSSVSSSPTQSGPVDSSPRQSSPRTRCPSRVYTPYMKLMEISASLPVQ